MKEFAEVDASYKTNQPAITSFVAAFGAYRERGQRIICRHLGVANLDGGADALYSMRGYLSAMKELQDQFGTEFMRTIGQRVAENSVFPPEANSVNAVMNMFNIAYHLNHPGVPQGAVGGYIWTSTGDKQGYMTIDGPYPCAGDMGLIEGMCKRFSPGTVKHQEGECRHKGGNACRYDVSW
jgi:hypothetical protein